MSESYPGGTIVSTDFGFNRVTFAGDRTHIVFFTETPGPIQIGKEGGKFEYEGVEGSHTFFGKEIRQQDSPLGTLLTVTLRPNADAGGVDLTVLVPRVFGVTGDKPLTFQTLAILTTSRGFVTGPGVQFTYTVVPLLATAEDVILPL